MNGLKFTNKSSLQMVFEKVKNKNSTKKQNKTKKTKKHWKSGKIWRPYKVPSIYAGGNSIEKKHCWHVQVCCQSPGSNSQTRQAFKRCLRRSKTKIAQNKTEKHWKSGKIWRPYKVLPSMLVGFNKKKKTLLAWSRLLPVL